MFFATTRDLFQILDNREWYSYGTTLLKQKLDVDERTLADLIGKLDRELQEAGSGDKVNVFTFNNVEYAGLESRRLDYERDKLAGTNHVERLITLGIYN